MRRVFLYLNIVLLIGLFSCDSKINPNEFTKNNQKLILKHKSDGYFLQKDSTDIIIDYNSIKYQKLLKWFMDNSNGWRSSPLSYSSSDLIIIGKDFRFRIFKDFVVIDYIDKNGKSKQFDKSVNKNEFEFLLQ